MAICFSIDLLRYQTGHRKLLHSFCSTISYHFEPKGWGTKYPYLLKHLYNGKLDWNDVPKVILELKDLQPRLERIGPKDVILDIEDISKKPTWVQEQSRIPHSRRFFVTNDGRNLIDELLLTLQNSLIETDLEIAQR